MSKPITIGQSHNLISILANNVVWDDLDAQIVQEIINNPRQAGNQFTAFLKNGGRVMVGQPGILKIDRSRAFDPTKFEGLGRGWKIAEQDERSLSLTELNLSKIRFETCLREGEDCIRGEEKFTRLKELPHIRLDAMVFLTFWQNQHLIPEVWKEKVDGYIQCIFFDGTILEDPHGFRCVLCLYWHDGKWHWGCYWLGREFYASYPSAVLAQ